jgi:DNA polymerase elongation subunit (family B)
MGKYDNLSIQEKKIKLEELKKQISKTQSDYDYYKALQLALKIVLNGTYGAFANPNFVISNTNIANAITSSAREVINWMLDHIEDYFYNMWHLDTNIHDLLQCLYVSLKDDTYYLHRKDGLVLDSKKILNDTPDNNAEYTLKKLLATYKLSSADIVDNDLEEITCNDIKYPVINKIKIYDFSNVKAIPNGYKIRPVPNSKNYDESKGVRSIPLIIYGDTDSISASSLIRYEDGQCKVSELYEKNIKNGSAGITLNGHESVKCTEKVLNYSKDKELYYAPVKRIIKHKVTKEKWKLTTKSGKEVIITNDHSMIVFRDGNQIEVKPSQILKTDKILAVIKNKKNK